jgi:hypothetical protein
MAFGFGSVDRVRVAGALLLAAALGCGPASGQAGSKASAASPAEVAALGRAVAPWVDRSDATREELTRPDAYEVRVRSGNRLVVVARRNLDGTVSSACVDSVEGAQEAATMPAPGRWEDR